MFEIYEIALGIGVIVAHISVGVLLYMSLVKKENSIKQEIEND